ncbi:MAG: DUF4230 domain-containing protein [Phormidesmis sp.]
MDSRMRDRQKSSSSKPDLDDKSSRGRSRRRSHKTDRSPLIKALQLLAIATTGGAVMVGSLALFAFLRSGGQFFTDVKAALTVKPPEETADVRTVVVEQVQAVSELTTAIFTMEAVVPAQSDRKLGELTIGKTNLLYVAYGEVQAGVDLEDLTTADVTTSEQGNAITLVLPAPELLDTKIDVERSNVYDYNRGLLNLGPDRAPELQALAEREALVKIERAACEQGILDQANDRAALVVTQLLKVAGFTDITVETTPSANTACKALS